MNGSSDQLESASGGLHEGKDSVASSTRAPRLGLIAGAGPLPQRIAAQLRAAGQSCPVFGFQGITEPGWVPAPRISQLGQLVTLVGQLRAAEVDRLLILGGFSKRLLMADSELLSPDEAALGLLASLSDLGDDGLIAVLADWLESQSFEIAGQDEALSAMTAQVGLISARAPRTEELADAEIGRGAVRALGQLGIGQAAAVCSRAVVALEAVEGTDTMIRRAGELAGGAVTVVKAARPGQDRRFDLPTIGLETIKVMQEAGATALAVEAGATLIVDEEAVARAADAAGIALWAFAPNSESV